MRTEIFADSKRMVETITKSFLQRTQLSLVGPSAISIYEDAMRLAPPTNWGVAAFSSGSTGRPKPIFHTWDCIEINSAWVGVQIGFTNHKHIHATMLSPIHCNAAFLSVVGTTMFGIKLRLRGRTQSIQDFMCMIGDATSLSLSPMNLREMIRHRVELPESLKTIVCASAPLTQELCKRAALLWGHRASIIRQGYGLTELVNFSFLMPDLSEKHSEWFRLYCENETPPVGKALGDTEIKFDTDGSISLKSLACGVPEWHKTGDVGWVDDDGYLVLTGRKQDTINRGGVSVFPGALEKHFPDATAFAVHSDVLGEDFGVYTSGNTPTCDSQFCAAITEPLPTTVTGKPMRSRMRDLLPAVPEIDYDRMLASLQHESSRAAGFDQNLIRNKTPRVAYALTQLTRVPVLAPKYGFSGYHAVRRAAEWIMDNIHDLPAQYPKDIWEALMCEEPMGIYGEFMARFIATRPSNRILEFGAGMGNTTRKVLENFGGEHYSATDLLSRSNPWDISVGPFGSGDFDVCFGTNVLHAVPETKRLDAVKNLIASVRPGGVVAISEGSPTIDGEPWPMNGLFPIDGWWDVGGFESRDYWVALFETAGLKQICTMRLGSQRHDHGGLVWGSRDG